MITRRQFGMGALTTGAALALGGGLRPAGAATLGDDGLYNQDWFVESFLELSDDLAEAHAAGKHLVVMFEQAGCPYCRKTHEVNLERQDYLPYLKENFAIIQLDLFGSREVTDFDGEAMEERAARAQVAGEFHADAGVLSQRPGGGCRNPAVRRKPPDSGLSITFLLLSFLRMVRSGTYKQEGFQRYANASSTRCARKARASRTGVLDRPGCRSDRRFPLSAKHVRPRPCKTASRRTERCMPLLPAAR
ncbi:MAG: thioredoxin fold domain-containing protein [Alphaproteobacteria bacterium]|nr:thioredoxin fold domain-containing protein [Alphaproteobacteria bacterium]